MTEAQFQTKFTRWAKYNIKESSAFELKLSKTNRLPFANIADHQFQNLLSVKRASLTYKISDASFGLKPFDCFTLVRTNAFLVVMFYKRGEKEFFMIDIEHLISFMEQHPEKKSITRDEASSISSIVGHLS